MFVLRRIAVSAATLLLALSGMSASTAAATESTTEPTVGVQLVLCDNDWHTPPCD